MTTSTPTPSPRFRVVRGARFLLDLRPIEEVPFHVAVESAFKEGQIVALVTVDDPRLQVGVEDAEIKRLREALTEIARILNLDDPRSYAADDREGAIDTAHGIASSAIGAA